MVNPAEWAGVKKTDTHGKYLIKLLVTGINVVFQFYPWFKFYLPLFRTHYHTLPYPKPKENKIYTKDKIEPQHILMLVEPLKVIQRKLIYFIPISFFTKNGWFDASHSPDLRV